MKKSRALAMAGLIMFIFSLRVNILGKELFTLLDPGKERIVDYEKYGEFEKVGTPDYKYKITDRKGLAAAIGEGIHPSNSIIKNMEYQEAKHKGRLEGSHWKFIDRDDTQLDFFKWATASEAAGVKLFYTAFALQKAGHYVHAIKAYYAIIVHYPKTVTWTLMWQTPIYLGPAAIDGINWLCRNHPELGMKLVGAKIKVNSFDDRDTENDIIITNPGKIVKCKPKNVAPKKVKLKKSKIVKSIGGKKVQLVKYKNGHWQLLVEGKPYIIKGMAYGATKIGQSPDNLDLADWMLCDYNKNGKIDGPYDSWVDKNGNNKQDADEPVVGDFQLLKEMGCNTIRNYHSAANKELLRELYENYGIMSIMGDFLGMYSVGSGASWEEGTDYSNPQQRAKMIEGVKKMVMEFKDEPYVLFWVLGNENNYGVANNCQKDPAVYYKFVNEVAKIIHQLDPDHPVAICNGDLGYLSYFVKYCPDVDIFGCNAYRGDKGFGGLWNEIKESCDRPVFITEYGIYSYKHKKSKEFSEKKQADYHYGCWEDITYNRGGSGAGNSLGGIVYQWLDEWWKAGHSSEFSPDEQDIWGGMDKNFDEPCSLDEWLGICSQGDGSKSPFLRQLRQAYYTYKDLWNDKK